MATYDNTYSRFIAWAKIILPLVALAILSTIFLFSRTIDPTRAIAISKVDVEELAREQQITAPRYAGVTDEGAAISFFAKSARPDLQNRANMFASEIEITIQTPEGARFDIIAQSGELDSVAGIVQIQEGVEILTSTGYLITGSQLTIALNTANVTAPKPVQAVGPLGSIDAGAMQLQQVGDKYVLVFKDGVKLVYEPVKTPGDKQ